MSMPLLPGVLLAGILAGGSVCLVVGASTSTDEAVEARRRRTTEDLGQRRVIGRRQSIEQR
jgi:hypothetical protein